MMKRDPTQLTALLFEAIDILRGSFSPEASLGWLAGLTLWKWISDRRFTLEGEKSKFRDSNGTFQVSEEAIFENLLNSRKDFSIAIERGYSNLEQSNPSLGNIFSTSGFFSRFVQETAARRDVYQVIQHLSRYSFAEDDLQKPSDIADALDEVLAATHQELHGYGEYFTPRSVALLMAGILSPKPDERILDPDCGAGDLLSACLHYNRDRDLAGQHLHIHGAESNALAWGMCFSRMLLRGADAKIIQQDWFANEKTGAADVVVSNPPFSLKWNANQGAVLQDFGLNISPPRFLDYAFILRALEMAKLKGRVALVTATGALYRLGSEQTIREFLLSSGYISTVVRLSSAQFSGIQTCLLFMEKEAQPRVRKNVLFIDVANVATGDIISDGSLLEQIRECIENPRTIPSFSFLASLKEIQEQGYNLDPSRYVARNASIILYDFDGEVNNLNTLLKKHDDARTSLFQVLKMDENL